jgi:hypothetical protein
MDPLMASLLDLLHELEGWDVPLTVGGGFGLYLKRHHLANSGQRTLFDQLPESRATNDLDLFVRTEILVDHERTEQIRAAIVRLGYSPVPTAKFIQWMKQIPVNGVPQPLKIDLLVGPLGARAADVHADARRARPKQMIEFHARRTEEALHVDDELIEVAFTGNRSTGEPHTATIYIPQAFPYLMMKLHAFDDRKDDADSDLGRHHALDLYTIVGMMTENEYERAKELGAAHAADGRVNRASAIVRDHFPGKPIGPPIPGAPSTHRSIQRGHYSGAKALGILRIREHTLFRDGYAGGIY